jgi:DNA repair protein RadA/Sms
MARAAARYACQSCGAAFPKWSGRCEACGQWNSIVEEAPRDETPRGLGAARGKPGGRRIDFVALAGAEHGPPRLVTGMAEFDRVCGGGLVPGSALLLGGDPGIGKSTLLLQVAARIAGIAACVYISGEEAIDQVRMRAARLGVGDAKVDLAAATAVRDVVASLETVPAPAVVVIDSIQTMYVDTLDSAPGTVAQVRAAAQELIHLAKRRGLSVILVGHVTKEGLIAGPRVLEHMVDTVLQFEGDRYRFYRTLRATKNRFGSTNELGIFEMTGSGLKTVPDPSALFLSGAAPAAGSAVHVAVEGTRCFLVEVQALVNKTELAMPRRVAVGFDRNRLAMLVAVLGRHAGLKLSSSDIFVTIAGGIRIDEPAADLAVALAVASAQFDIPLSSAVAAFGEISLTGGLRSSSQSERRVAEAQRAGFDRIVVPSADARRAGRGVTGATDLRGAFAATLGDTPRSASGATNEEWGV